MNVPPYVTRLPLAIVEPEGFAAYLAEACAMMPPDVACYVTRWTADGLRKRGALCFVTGDGLSGFAVLGDGELVGLFSAVRGRGDALIEVAIDHGATWLGCYDGRLPGLYARHGFRIVERHPFDPTQAEANAPAGEPAYLRMELAA